MHLDFVIQYLFSYCTEFVTLLHCCILTTVHHANKL